MKMCKLIFRDFLFAEEQLVQSKWNFLANGKKIEIWFPQFFLIVHNEGTRCDKEVEMIKLMNLISNY